MRKRKWVLYVVVILASLTITGFSAYRLLKTNDRIKKYVLSELQPLVGENFDISRVHLTANTIHFFGVEIPLSNPTYSLHINDLRIGYNLIRAITSKPAFSAISNDILLVKPCLIISSFPVDSTQNERAISSPIAEFKKLENGHNYRIKYLKFLDRLSIQGGKVVFKDVNGREIEIGHSLDGVLFSEKKDSLHLRLSGKLFSSDHDNLFIEGKAESKSGKIQCFNVTFEDYELNTPLPDIFPNIINFSQGSLKGKLILTNDPANIMGFDLNGSLRLANASANIKDKLFSVSDIDFQSRIEHWNLFIDHAMQKVNDAPVKVTGEIKSFFQPQFDLNLSTESFAVSKFSHIFKKKLQGRAKLNADISGPLNALHINCNFFSRRISVAGAVFKNLRMNTFYHKGILNFNKCDVELLRNELRLAGKIDFNSKKRLLDGNVTSSGNIAPLLQPIVHDTSYSYPTWLDAEISGQLNNPTIFGSYGLTFIKDKKDSLTLRSAFSFHNQILRSSPLSENGGPKFKGLVDFSHSPMTFNFTMDGFFQVLPYFYDASFEKNVTSNVTTSISAYGAVNRFAVDAKVSTLEGGYFKTDIANVATQIVRNSDAMKASGEIFIYPGSTREFQGKFSFNKSKDSINLQQLTFGDQLTASFAAIRNGMSLRKISGKFILNDFDVSRFFAKDSSFKGLLSSDITISGTDREPEIDGHLDLRNAYLYENGPYKSNLFFKYDSSNFKLQRFIFNSDESTLLYAYGNYNSQIDKMHFNVTGAGFDVAQLSRRSSSGPSIISGNSFVDLKFAGKLSTPKISGVVAVKDGKLLKFPFNELEVQLGINEKRLIVKQEQSNPVLNIKQFRLNRFDNYELHGSGVLPLRSDDSLHLSLSGHGNFLTLFSDLTPYFQESSSSGTFTARVSGTPADPVLEAARLNISDGSLKFESVIPPLTDLHADVEFEPDDQFLHIKTLAGEMGRKPFKISNQLATDVVAAVDLENIVLGGAGINFGVLELESTDQGVPLNITGLMQRGVYGNLVLGGRNDDEKFYIAGPATSPRMRGVIHLYNTQFMYPFWESAEKPSPFISELLENMQWDLLVTPGQDVRYIRSFPGAVDKLYVNLQLDRQYSALEFSGKIADESFRINGHVRSTNGFIEYLGLNFRIERGGAEFDKSGLIPVVYGQARTTVTDSVGIPTQVMLTAQTVDETMTKDQADDIVREEQGRARWNHIRFKLSSDNPNLGSSEEQILAALGYSTGSLQNTAFDAIGLSTENILFRPLFRPVERTLENVFGLDYVRFSSRFAKNIIDFNLNNNYELNTRLALLRSTKVIVGKYLADHFFFQYTGQVEAGIDYRYKGKGVGLHHQLGFEYQINPKLLLELEYDYDSLMRYNPEDKRIVLRHWFPF